MDDDSKKILLSTNESISHLQVKVKDKILYVVDFSEVVHN
jgi:hypothetical protein